jgi:hypothetical protein
MVRIELVFTLSSSIGCRARPSTQCHTSNQRTSLLVEVSEQRGDDERDAGQADGEADRQQDHRHPERETEHHENKADDRERGASKKPTMFCSAATCDVLPSSKKYPSPGSTHRGLQSAIATGRRPRQPAFFFERGQHGGRLFAAKAENPRDLRHSDRQRRCALELLSQPQQAGVDS